MKKKIAILLAAVMTATMVPATAALADSSNSITQVVTVKDGDFNDDVYLKIQPGGEIKMDDTIILTLENGEFDEDDIDKHTSGKGISYYDYKALDKELGEKGSYDELKKEYEYWTTTGNLTPEKAYDQVLYKPMNNLKTVDLPYKLKRNTKKELEVTLFALPDSIAGEKFAEVNKPVYKIPLPFTASGTGSVTVSVDSNGTSIRGGVSYTIATSASKSGDTVTTVDEIKVGSDDIKLGVVTIKETVYGTFEPGKTVTLKLNSGFEFKKVKPEKESERLTISAGINADFKPIIVDVDKQLKDNTFEFTIPEQIDSTNSDDKFKSQKPAAIKISNLWVTPEDDDNLGEIKLTVNGASAGISKETITVAERGDYGFTLKAVEDPTTIYAGRKGYEDANGNTDYNAVKDLDYDDDDDYGSYISSDAAKEYDSDDYLSATVEFAEVTADSWNTNRKLKFTVPDEVKIYDYEIDEEEDCSIGAEGVKITNDGHTLEIDGSNSKVDVDASEASSFELQLTLSADANYEGDVSVKVEGGGISADDANEVVVAKVVKPITLETSSTKTNMGYQKMDTADIKITEADAGVLVKNGTVEIAIDSVYGESELGFADENIDYEIEGDLKIKNFKVKEGAISFTVDSSSVEASSITIKNVKIGTTRSIPQGSYGLKVSGSAIINNYSEGAVDDGSESGEKGLGYFDDNEAIKFADYISITTETGTLDKVVKVTIGEKTILVGDESYEMDVAPYIQEESSSTMVPLRFVMIALGVDSDSVGDFQNSQRVSFDANTKTATIFYAAGTNTTTIQFTAGSNIMKVNGAEIPMENGVKAEIKDSRMFVPFRAIGTAVNVKVGWDADTRTATYNDGTVSVG